MDFSHGYYYALLDLVDIFFDGSVDQTTLEECARYMFGTKGYMIFTIDKLVMLLVRHVGVWIIAMCTFAFNNQCICRYDKSLQMTSLGVW